jgi:hypothetical protein
MDQAFVDSSTYLGVENAFTSDVTTLEAHVSRARALSHSYISRGHKHWLGLYR